MRTLICIAIALTCSSFNLLAQDKSKLQWTDYLKDGYSLKIPEQWIIQPANNQATLFKIFAPRESSKDFYQENLTLVVHDVNHLNVDLDMYSEMLFQEYKKRLDNVSLVQNKREVTEKLDYQYLRYIGKDGATQILLDQYVWLYKGEALILTFSSEASKHYAYKFIGQKMLDSFAFALD